MFTSFTNIQIKPFPDVLHSFCHNPEAGLGNTIGFHFRAPWSQILPSAWLAPLPGEPPLSALGYTQAACNRGLC